MTTITIDEEVDLPRKSFHSREDFYESFAETFFSQFLEFHALPQSEISFSLRRKQKEMQSKEMAEFIRV